MTPILVQFYFFYFIEKSEKKISLGRNGLISDTEFFLQIYYSFFYYFFKGM